MQLLHAYSWLLAVAAVFGVPLLLSYYLVRDPAARLLLEAGPDLLRARGQRGGDEVQVAAEAGDRPQRRLDDGLRGGPVQKKDPNEKVDMEKLIEALRAHRSQRDEGDERPPLRPGAGAGGDHHPQRGRGRRSADQGTDHAIGTLEFRILANTRDHRQLIEPADADPEAQTIVDSGGTGWVGGCRWSGSEARIHA